MSLKDAKLQIKIVGGFIMRNLEHADVATRGGIEWLYADGARGLRRDTRKIVRTTASLHESESLNLKSWSKIAIRNLARQITKL